MTPFRLKLLYKWRYFCLWIALTIALLGIQKFNYDNIDLPKRSFSNSTKTRKDNSSLIPFHPFLEGQPKSVVVLSYQRCGSSFFSDMFNKNPNAFYLFEPVDAIYSSIYGTQTGWNVPSDITCYANGTERIPPETEIEEVANTLLDILTCDVERLPMETLTHRYLYMDYYQSPNPYISCVRNRTIMKEASKCLSLSPKQYCGVRFGSKTEEILQECYQFHTDSKFLLKHPNRSAIIPYVDCRRKIRRRVLDKCGKKWMDICEPRPIRAVKTVRATMASMEPLLSSLPNFRVIHLIRDPRAVVLSRQHFDPSSVGRFSFSSSAKSLKAGEALIYCRTLARDIKTRLELEKRFPDDNVDLERTSSNSARIRKDNISLIPFHPFLEDQPKSVVVLSYQRCGSSFFSDMFNKNPNAFYLFEPVDAIYSSIYGTQTGWNVPSDITCYANGTERIPPETEIYEVSKTLLDIMTCDVKRLPMETLTHRFLYKEFYQWPNAYIDCARDPTLLREASACLSLFPKQYCGARFGVKTEEILHECYKLHTDSNFLLKHPNRSVITPYVDCRRKVRRSFLDKCGKTWMDICEPRPIRAVKTVRATMASMEPLLSSLPNFRVIHLMRDPRAVILSRQNFDHSAISRYALNSSGISLKAAEALLYCRTVARDIKIRLELEKRYPGRIYPMFYEDFMENLTLYTNKIYEFLDISSPTNTFWWKRQISMQYGEKSRKIPSKWKTKLTFRESKTITDNCMDLFKLVEYKWNM